MDDRRVVAERIENVSDQVVSPPVGFPVYGPVQFGPGFRWLESVNGDAPWGVWLGHASPRGERGLLVGTVLRDAFDSSYAPNEPDRTWAAAMAAGDRFLDVIAPQRSIASPDLGEAVRQHVHQWIGRHTSWKRVRWEVGGAWVRAAVWRFAGTWMAFSADLPDSYLLAVGVGLVPAGLSLEVVDGSAYGVDFARPVKIGNLCRSSPDMIMPQPNWDRVHPDQLALLERG